MAVPFGLAADATAIHGPSSTASTIDERIRQGQAEIGRLYAQKLQLLEGSGNHRSVLGLVAKSGMERRVRFKVRAEDLAAPDVPRATPRRFTAREDDLLASVDSHRVTSRRRDWHVSAWDPSPAPDPPTPEARGGMLFSSSALAVKRDVKAFPRSARMRELSELVDDECERGVSLSGLRAHRERVARNAHPLGLANRDRLPCARVLPFGPDYQSQTSRALQEGAEQASPASEEEQDFSEAAGANVRSSDQPSEETAEQELQKPRHPTLADPGDPRPWGLRGRPADVRNRPAKPNCRQSTHYVEDGLSANDTHGCLEALRKGIHDLESSDPARLARLATALEVRTYDIRMSDAVRALFLVSDGAALVKALGRHGAGNSTAGNRRGEQYERAGESMANSARRMVAGISSRSIDSPARHVADGLQAMAATRTGRQEYLDAFMARLGLLLRHQRRTVTSQVACIAAGALGRMKHDHGDTGAPLSAHGGSSPDNKEANRQFVRDLNARLVELRHDLVEDDLGLLHEAYFGAYLGEEETRHLLTRAGRLHTGLLRENCMHKDVWVRIERAIRNRWPTLIPCLPQPTQHYCQQLREEGEKC